MIRPYAKEMLSLYSGGASQAEIATRFGISQPHACRILKELPGYEPRNRAKRNQRGEKHPNWAGDSICYKSAHLRVGRQRGNPQHCEVCGDSSLAQYKGKYEWCNLTGKYHDVNDYRRMCRKCHRKFDAVRRTSNGH